VRLFSNSVDTDIRTIHAILQPRRMVRWVYIARVVLAGLLYAAVLLGRVSLSPAVARYAELLASLTLVAALLVTMVSGVFSEIKERPLGRNFIYLQLVFDIALVTVIVHVTGGGESQFAALYMLVIATASLLLPAGGGLLIAALAIVLYFADALWIAGAYARLTTSGAATLDPRVWMQLAVITFVALGSGFLSAKLKEAGAGKERLAAELVNLRLQAADILRNIRSGILTIDSSGALLHANPAAYALLGLPQDSYVGQPILPALREISTDLAAMLERAVTHAVRMTRAEGVIRTSGRVFPIGMTTTYAEDGGHPFTATAIFQDLSSQKRLDALNLRAQRLEAVAELSASLAHEIKNPLASIRSAVEQLAARPQANDDDRTLGRLIVRESDRLSRLLTEFLDFARVRATRFERVDIGAVARGATDLAAAHPNHTEIVDVICNTPLTPLYIEGDEDLLHRAVFNLALNALQASPDRGRVQVDVTRAAPEQIPMGVGFENGAVAIKVEDDGAGIPSSIRDRMFDPFITTKPGGSGLGLPVVHRAIESHHGVVLVDTSDEGTRFTVLLPLAQQHGDQT
jgi:two-component system sensor histidine kinase PilS (NtrC family)